MLEIGLLVNVNHDFQNSNWMNYSVDELLEVTALPKCSTPLAIQKILRPNYQLNNWFDNGEQGEISVGTNGFVIVGILWNIFRMIVITF